MWTAFSTSLVRKSIHDERGVLRSRGHWCSDSDGFVFMMDDWRWEHTIQTQTACAWDGGYAVTTEQGHVGLCCLCGSASVLANKRSTVTQKHVDNGSITQSWDRSGLRGRGEVPLRWLGWIYDGIDGKMDWFISGEGEQEVVSSEVPRGAFRTRWCFSESVTLPTAGTRARGPQPTM